MYTCGNETAALKSSTDNVEIDVKGLQKRGRKSCSITVELNNLTMRISVR